MIVIFGRQGKNNLLYFLLFCNYPPLRENRILASYCPQPYKKSETGMSFKHTGFTDLIKF